MYYFIFISITIMSLLIRGKNHLINSMIIETLNNVFHFPPTNCEVLTNMHRMPQIQKVVL